MTNPLPPLLDSIIALWRSSTLIQGAMSLGGFATICYLELTGRSPSQILAGMVGTMIGYYFGTKIAQQEVT